MKRFDKRYLYYSFLTGFLGSLLILYVIFGELFTDPEVPVADMSVLIPILAIAFIVIYACFVAYSIAFYKLSGYEFTENEIKCNMGVLFRKRSVLDYSKIHAVNKKQNILHRIFDIAVLTIDSGSTNTSHQAEITIFERTATVDALMEKLNLLREGKLTEEGSATGEDKVLLSENDKLYSFTSKKKMLYTLFNLASMALVMAFLFVTAIFVISVFKLTVDASLFGTWGTYLIGATVAMVVLMLISEIFMLIGSVIQSFIGYYDFNISKHGNEIKISYGLLNKQTNTFSYDRIKAVKISQGILQRLLGFATVRLEVIGYINGSGNDAGQIGVLVPFCKYSEVDEILGRILPEFIPEKKQTSAVSFFPFVSWFLLIFGGIVGIALSVVLAIFAIFEVSSTVILATVIPIVGVALFVIGVMLLRSFLAYRNNGLALKDGRITAYCGGFTRNVTVFMAKNLISVEDVTTPLRKKAGIASLVLHLKTNSTSNEIKVHMQEDALCAQLENLLTL